MTRLITREQQKVLDSRFSEVTGLPSILLMEQAASGISEFIVDLVQAYDTGTDYDVVFFYRSR